MSVYLIFGYYEGAFFCVVFNLLSLLGGEAIGGAFYFAILLCP